jgi:preprotein translocase subunit YajC
MHQPKRSVARLIWVLLSATMPRFIVDDELLVQTKFLRISYMISYAFAQTAAGAQSAPGWTSFLPLVLMFVVLYFIMIRPQMKRQKEHKAMIDSLAVGDEVVCAGGILGRITKVIESKVMVEVADGVEIQVQRTAVAAPLPQGSLKK